MLQKVAGRPREGARLQTKQLGRVDNGAVLMCSIQQAHYTRQCEWNAMAGGSGAGWFSQVAMFPFWRLLRCDGDNEQGFSAPPHRCSVVFIAGAVAQNRGFTH